MQVHTIERQDKDALKDSLKDFLFEPITEELCEKMEKEINKFFIYHNAGKITCKVVMIENDYDITYYVDDEQIELKVVESKESITHTEQIVS